MQRYGKYGANPNFLIGAYKIHENIPIQKIFEVFVHVPRKTPASVLNKLYLKLKVLKFSCGMILFPLIVYVKHKCFIIIFHK